MAFPPEVQTVTVRMGPVLNAGGEPVRGAALMVTLSQTVHILSNGTILKSAEFVRTGEDGIAEVTVAATDSTGLDRTGFTYRIFATGITAGGGVDVALPAAAPAVSVEDLAPVPQSDGTVVWVPPTGWVQDTDLATVATTGAYTDLSGVPTLATVATTGDYTDLTGSPALAPVATSGVYTDLTARPTLGTAAATDATDYATAAQGAAADAAQPAAALTAFTPVKKLLTEAGTRPLGVQVLGDSTGNDTTEWVYKLAQHVAATYPAWTVHHRLWNDTRQAYDAPTVIQTGPAGEQHLLVETGRTTRRLSPGAITHISGVMDVRIKMAANDWSLSSGSTVVIGREQGAGQRSWWMQLNTTGNPQFTVSSDGTALNTQTCPVAVPFTDGQTGWVRVVYTPDDGAGNRTSQFYTSTDGTTWTTLGALVVTAGAITPYNAPNATLDLGGRGGAAGMPGRIYEVRVLDGADGPNTVPVLPASWAETPPPGTPMSVVGSPVLTFVNGSHPGASISYLGDATRLPKMTPDYGQQVVFLSDSHNEQSRQDAEFLTLYDTWVGQVQTRLLGVPLVVLTQNPESGAANAVAHAARRTNLLTYTAAKRIDAIDTYKAFLDYGDWAADLMADTVHPNTAGQQVWTDAVTAAFDATRAS